MNRWILNKASFLKLMWHIWPVFCWEDTCWRGHAGVSRHGQTSANCAQQICIAAGFMRGLEHTQSVMLGVYEARLLSALAVD